MTEVRVLCIPLKINDGGVSIFGMVESVSEYEDFQTNMLYVKVDGSSKQLKENRKHKKRK